MVLPIYAYGQPVLKRMGINVEKDYPELNVLIADMWETMYNAHGVGLAAPQIGKSLRIFVVDTIQVLDEDSDETGIKKVFINAEMVEETGEEWDYEEGCLSIPGVRGDVTRQDTIRLKYFNENFEEIEEEFDGINARVIQHEYDHIDGKIFTDKLKPIKKRMVQRKLDSIRKGKVDIDYRMKFRWKA